MEEEKVIFMVLRGVEGESLYIGDESTAFRLAGPKPWGGGDLIYKFAVDVKELRRELDRFNPRLLEASGAPGSDFREDAS